MQLIMASVFLSSVWNNISFNFQYCFSCYCSDFTMLNYFLYCIWLFSETITSLSRIEYSHFHLNVFCAIIVCFRACCTLKIFSTFRSLLFLNEYYVILIPRFLAFRFLDDNKLIVCPNAGLLRNHLLPDANFLYCIAMLCFLSLSRFINFVIRQWDRKLQSRIYSNYYFTFKYMYINFRTDN